MVTWDSAGESLRLAAHYRDMTDGELLDLARQKSSLTETAQQALQQELSLRRLQDQEVLPPKPAPPPDIPDEDDPYAEERRLFVIRTVYSLRDALQLQRILDVAGVPFYIGPEKATGVDAVTSNFADGLPVRIMSIGWQYAYGPLQSYEPKDEPDEEKEEISANSAIRCPRCRSTEVVFERLVRQASSPGNEPPPPKFEWTCASCGKEWQDDGIETVG